MWEAALTTYSSFSLGLEKASVSLKPPKSHLADNQLQVSLASLIQMALIYQLQVWGCLQQW